MEDCSFVNTEYLTKETRNLNRKIQRKAEKTPKNEKPSKSSKLKDESMEWYVSKKSTTYNWTAKENRRYIKFLLEHSHLLKLSAFEKIGKKVNLQMSKCVKTRTATQCHTHHQKMMNKYGNIESIIDNLSSILDETMKKTCQTIIKAEVNEYIQGPYINKAIEMKSASEILAVESLLSGVKHNLGPLDLLQEIYEPEKSTTQKDLLDWIDIDAFLS